MYYMRQKYIFNIFLKNIEVIRMIQKTALFSFSFLSSDRKAQASPQAPYTADAGLELHILLSPNVEITSRTK